MSITVEASWNGGAYADLQTIVTTSAAPVVTTPKSVAIFQRNGSDQANISISGTVNGVAYSGTLSNQPKGDGTLTVRVKSNPTDATTVTKIGIGDVFLIWGDSLCATSEAFYQSNANSLKVRIWVNDGSNVWFDNTNLGFPFLTAQWLRAYEQIQLDQGVPCGFFQAGSAGSSAGDWAPGGTLYNAALAQVTASGINSVRACLAHIGTNDVNGSTISAATEAAAIKLIADGFVADVVGAPKSYVCIFPDRNPSDAGGAAQTRLAMDAIRQGIIDSYAEASIEVGPNTTGQAPADQTHPDTSAMSLETGNNWYLSLKAVAYGGTSHRSPRIASARYKGDLAHTLVTLDQALSNAVSSSVAGFRVTDNGTPVASLSAQVVQSSTTILLTHTAIAGTGKVSFASGKDAVGATIPRSANITMPDGSTHTVAQEPQFDVVIGAIQPSPSVSPSSSVSPSPSPSSSLSPSSSPSASLSPSSSVSASASRSVSPSSSVSSSLSPSPSPSVGNSPSPSASTSQSHSASASQSSSVSSSPSSSASHSPSPSPDLPQATPDVVVIC